MYRISYLALAGMVGVSLGPSLAGQGAPAAATAATFYVDSEKGDDARNGTSPEQAWKTLARLNREPLTAGSRVLLQAGRTYAGYLKPQGSGEPGRPNLIDRYGEGAKPCIRTEGGPDNAEQAGVVLDNQQQWEIRNLDISGGYRGVVIRLKDYGVARHIHLLGLDIHDVHGGSTGDDSGILCSNSGPTTAFDDLRIEGCRIERVDRNGILITDWPGPPSDAHRSTGVVIRGNGLRDIGGDGIFILACKGAVIERNVLRYAHQRVGRKPGERACAGIWPQHSEDTLIQSNEVSHTAVGGLTVWDSEAFDDDGSCTGTIFQYNYSHDNAGGFLLNCGGKGTIVRYNLSQDDATATFTFESDTAADSLVYNNTIYVRPELKVQVVRNTFGKPHGIRFYNNIFCISGEAQYAFGSIQDVGFDHNAFFGNHVNRPADEHAVSTDPQLAAPGSGKDGLDALAGYQLQATSPCRGAGRIIPANGGRDFQGKPVPDQAPPDVGAFQDRR
jgi:hypothetical protein